MKGSLILSFFIATINFYSIKCTSNYNSFIQSYLNKANSRNVGQSKLRDFQELRSYTNSYNLIKNSLVNLAEDLNEVNGLFPNVSEGCLNQSLVLIGGLATPWARSCKILFILF